MKHAVLLGDPAHFRIKSGRNPYTRTKWGWRKRVNKERALEQWDSLKALLMSLGAQVHVAPADPRFSGTVFPANAGFLYPLYDNLPADEKCFYMSNLTSHREDEKQLYARKISELGFKLGNLPHDFEGEADFFPCGDFYLFCSGQIRPMGFRPQWGWPPYRFQFSHRSDSRNQAALEKIVGRERLIPITLKDGRYYHGDTALFSFGAKREYLAAYLPAMDSASQERLRNKLGKRLVPLTQTEAQSFVANSFQLFTDHGPHLILPRGVSQGFLRNMESLGLASSQVDVSEFFEKGGGSIKCMLCDLGLV